MKAHSTVLRGNCHSGLEIFYQKNVIIPYLGKNEENGGSRQNSQNRER